MIKVYNEWKKILNVDALAKDRLLACYLSMFETSLQLIRHSKSYMNTVKQKPLELRKYLFIFYSRLSRVYDWISRI